MVAGVLYEARQRDLERRTEVVELRFTTRGTALVPVGVAGGKAAQTDAVMVQEVTPEGGDRLGSRGLVVKGPEAIHNVVNS
jgi:hypothetical protein